MAEVELTSAPNGDARRTPRVDFSAQVELLAPDDRADEPRVLIAQALDLGTGGIGLTMRERLPVGTKVTCRLALDGRDAVLCGRVAWSRANTSPRPHGVGVCFDVLAAPERELLVHVIERTQAGYRPIELRFEGAQTPLIARACATAEGLRVSTPLPMLNQGAELAVRFEGEGQAFVGRVTGVVVREEDGTRRLEVDLALSDAASVRFRRQARYGYADELHSAVGAPTARARASASASTSADADDDPSSTGRHPVRPRRMAGSVEPAAAEPTVDVVPMHRLGGVLRVVGSLLFAALCGALLSASIERSWQALDPAQPEQGSTRRAVKARDDRVSATRNAVETAPLLAGHSPDGELAGGPAAQLEVPSAQAAVLEDANKATQHATALAPPHDDAVATAQLSQPTKPASTSTPALPALAVKDGVTVVTVPYIGNLDGMETRTWASPPAVAIDLPHGRALIAHGYYPLSGGIAAGLRVRARNEQLLVRVLLAQPVSRIAVSAQRESLEIRLTPTP